MPEPRTAQDIRSELEHERRQLAEDVAALRAEVKAVAPYVLGGLAALYALKKGMSLRRRRSGD